MQEKIKRKLEKFFAKYNYLQYKKGQLLILAGDNPAGIFYLKSGTVRVYYITRQGNEVIVNIYKAPSFFPMMWVVSNLPNGYYHEAITPAEVWRAPKEDVLAFVREEPDVLFDLTARLFKGMDGLLSRMVYLMSGSAYKRLTLEIIISTKRFGSPHGSHRNIHIKTTQKDFALQTGLTRETVSREMKHLEEKRLVTFTKNVLIVKDLKKLEAELIEES